MHDAVELEKRGIPTAAIVTKSFIRGAQVQRDALGMRPLEPVVVEHPLSILSDEQMESRAQEAVPQVKKILLKR